MARSSGTFKPGNVPAGLLYTPELMAAVCRRIAEGELLSVICAEPGMPARRTVWDWTQSYPEAAEMYRAAREISAHAIEDEALAMCREMATPEFAEGNGYRRAMAMNSSLSHLRWVAAKRNPRSYSDKIPPNATVAVQINTNFALGDPNADAAVTSPHTLSLTATIPPTTPEGDLMDERHFNMLRPEKPEYGVQIKEKPVKVPRQKASS